MSGKIALPIRDDLGIAVDGDVHLGGSFPAQHGASAEMGLDIDAMRRHQ